MKRILPLLLSFCMILALAACGHGDEETSAEEVLTGTVRYMNADPALQESWQRKHTLRNAVYRWRSSLPARKII